MSGFIPFFNKRRDFLKSVVAGTALTIIHPFKIFANIKKENQAMIRVIKKSEQFNDVIFGGRFHANKPVFQGKTTVKPYSSLFYWSNGYVHEKCEFGLHPHQGFEIMTFLFEGKISHFDTQTQVWTDLEAGGFQVIQSNSGIQHQERITEGSRAFQIWFDPNFKQAVQQKPAYVDYHSNDFQPTMEAGVATISYIGSGSKVQALTPDLTIKKLIFQQKTKKSIALNEQCSYTFYVLKGDGIVENSPIAQDDAIRVSGSSSLNIDFEGELFYIELPTVLPYKAVWE
ncbi:MAG: pirin family protein [Chitinophagales bacterium]|jgi:redox-sensitive bicupin YhaK (pirin superfamily)|nr:pirin family protein [Chitinophagales bacterium]HNL06620.1 pirin family protein [Chitinophagales bacterium]